MVHILFCFLGGVSKKDIKKQKSDQYKHFNRKEGKSCQEQIRSY